jgi:Family of unknown function (DUF6152)
MKKTLLALALAAAAHPAGVRAHHSFASEFDANQPVSLKGTVTKVEFINPHSWIHIEVTNADGTKAAWEVEGGTPNTLFRKGINDSTLPIGTPIAVDGYKARDGSNRMSGRNITLADGRQVFLSGSAPP